MPEICVPNGPTYNERIFGFIPYRKPKPAPRRSRGKPEPRKKNTMIRPVLPKHCLDPEAPPFEAWQLSKRDTLLTQELLLLIKQIRYEQEFGNIHLCERNADAELCYRIIRYLES
jgi:hypothetical protein